MCPQAESPITPSRIPASGRTDAKATREMSHHRFTNPRTTKNALGRALVIGALSLTTLAVSIDTANAQAPCIRTGTPPEFPSWTNPAKVSAFASSDGGRALAAAESKIGAPYVWGATGRTRSTAPASFDGPMHKRAFRFRELPTTRLSAELRFPGRPPAG